VAEVLTEADLRGVESHGSTRVAGYLSMMKLGLLNPRPKVQVMRDLPATAMLEGDNAFGIVVARQAMQMAMDKARTAGIACVTTRNVTHTGLVGFYTMMAAHAGFIGVSMNNGPAILPPFGGTTPTYATNPFSFAVPAGDKDPIVLDMATSVVARGKIRRAAQAGEPIPEGWALDAEGRPTTDAQAAYDGLVLPLGGPKGSGLSLMMEVLGGVMSGSAFGGEVGNQYSDHDRPQDVGHCFIAFRPDLAVSADAYRTRIDALVERAKASPRVAEDQPILMPGEPEALTERERLRDGIPLSAEDRAGLRGEAERAELAPPPFLAG
jgi:LDH2 family malate/lactate/ureidoglycolate dehydrogenase